MRLAPRRRLALEPCWSACDRCHGMRRRRSWAGRGVAHFRGLLAVSILEIGMISRSYSTATWDTLRPTPFCEEVCQGQGGGHPRPSVTVVGCQPDLSEDLTVLFTLGRGVPKATGWRSAPL